MSAARRIELQLQVSRYANQARALLSKSLEGFDARHVGGHEFSQIDLERNLSCACAEQFRNLRDTQTAGEPDDASIGLLNDADPALHALLKRKTQATSEGILLRKPWLDATLTSYLTAGRDSSHDPLNAMGLTSEAHRAVTQNQRNKRSASARTRIDVRAHRRGTWLAPEHCLLPVKHSRQQHEVVREAICLCVVSPCRRRSRVRYTGVSTVGTR